MEKRGKDGQESQNQRNMDRWKKDWRMVWKRVKAGREEMRGGGWGKGGPKK